MYIYAHIHKCNINLYIIREHKTYVREEKSKLLGQTSNLEGQHQEDQKVLS